MISPPSISAIFATMRFMNSRSCEVISSAPGSDFRNCSSQMIDSMSRWFVGSSISRTSGLPEQHARERDAHLPAARQRCRRRRRSARRRSRGRAAPRAPALRACSRRGARTLPARRRSASRILSISSARAGSSMRLLQRLELVVQVAQAAAARDRLVEHGAARHLLDVLPEVADGQPLRDRHLALVGTPLRRRSCGRAWSCRRRSGPTRPTFSPGLS